MFTRFQTMNLASIATFVAAGVLLGSSAQARSTGASKDVSQFAGNHALVSEHLGLCSPILDVFISTDNEGTLVDAGGFVFPHVNGGTITYEDQSSKSVEKSFTTNDNRLVYEGHVFDKIQRTNSKSYIELKLLSKGKLRLISKTTDQAINGAGVLTTVCTYKKVADASTPTPAPTPNGIR